MVFSFQCPFPTEQQGPLNPVLNYTTIQVRFLNLAGDNAPRRLELQSPVGAVSITATDFGKLSDSVVRPNNESAFAWVLPASTDTSGTFRSTTATRFLGRGSVYTLIALPSTSASTQLIEPVVSSNLNQVPIALFPKALPARQIDTVLALAAQADSIPQGATRIRAVNCVYDNSLTFDLAIGCPSGDLVAGTLPYRAVSAYRTVQAQGGNVTVSLITRVQGRSDTIMGGAGRTSRTIINGTYSIPAQMAQSYSLIIYRNKGGFVDILPINDRTNESPIVRPGETPKSSIRIANFSSLVVDSVQYRSSGSFTQLQTQIGDTVLTPFIELTACLSVGRDTLVVNSSAGRTIVSTSFETGRSYTLFAGRSDMGRQSTIVAPSRTPIDPMRALVRFVNFLPQPVSLQRGTYERSETTVLFSSLASGAMSDEQVLPVGNIPLITFSTTQPQRLIQTGVPELERGKSYFVVLAPDPKNSAVARMYLMRDVPNGMPATAIQPIVQGAFVQFVNASSDGKRIGLEFGDSPSAVGPVTLFYGTPQMTVLRTNTYFFKNLPLNINSFTVQDKQRRVFVFTGDSTRQVLDNIAGLRDSAVIDTFGTRHPFVPRMGIETSSMFRFMNGSQDFNKMYVTPVGGGAFEISSTGTSTQYPFIVPLNNRGLNFSRPFGISDARRYELTFQSLDTLPSYAINIRNLVFQSNRAYTIIFTGRRFRLPMDTTLRNNYNAIVLPEF
jgi:hypothetical protein